MPAGISESPSVPHLRSDDGVWYDGCHVAVGNEAFMNLLLTGLRQVGKSTVCQAVVELARAQGRQPQGVLSPALFDSSGAKVGFEVLDVATGERWLLAHTVRELDGPRIGPYVLDSAGLVRSIIALTRACEGADLMIVDEIGPLELKRNEGFAPVLDCLPLQGPGHLLLVVRPSLLPEVRRRLGGDFAICTVTEGNRAILPAHILQEFWPDD
jgi:nucleoside-triphosphatase